MEFDWTMYEALFGNVSLGNPLFRTPFVAEEFFKTSNMSARSMETDKKLFKNIIRRNQGLRQHLLSGFIQGFDANIKRF